MVELEKAPDVEGRPELAGLARWEATVWAAAGVTAFDQAAWWAARFAVWAAEEHAELLPDGEADKHTLVVLTALGLYDAAHRTGTARYEPLPLWTAVVLLSSDPLARELAGRTLVGSGDAGRLRRSDRARLDALLVDQDNAAWEMLRLGAVDLLKAHAYADASEGRDASRTTLADRHRALGDTGATIAPDWYSRPAQ